MSHYVSTSLGFAAGFVACALIQWHPALGAGAAITAIGGLKVLALWADLRGGRA